ncbi:MAG: monofunctional biosynthetic peptidoglycan transglycosylase [Steroidobacteraceae bacterium]
MIRRLGTFLLWLTAIWFALTLAIVFLLRWLDPPTTSFMVRARLSAWHADDTAFRFQHEWVDENRISPNLKLAVIASEDQLFAEHWGFDVKSINKALEERQRGKRARGASTLSQQVAKNLFLWPGQSWIRKGIESYFTVLIETMWPKRRILEVYLNIAEFGKGIYGAEAAARRFFGKSAARVSAPDAALLAAVLPNPIRLKVAAPSRYVRSRQQWILRQMRSLGGSSYLKQFEQEPRSAQN